MAAHTPSFTIFWSRGWPHNAVRISTFCASSASEFYHTVSITPEARCKHSGFCGWCECEVWSLMTVTDVVRICCTILCLNLRTVKINWHCDGLFRPFQKENREVVSTTASTKHLNGSGSRARQAGLVLFFGVMLTNE